nr:MAG TPA: hypothetical protein [Caudoviricetes sp.]
MFIVPFFVIISCIFKSISSSCTLFMIFYPFRL